MHRCRDAAHGPVAAAVQSCRSMPDVWQNASERIRYAASRGGTVLPNTWATCIHSWPRRCGLRRETIWPRHFRRDGWLLTASPIVETVTGSRATSAEARVQPEMTATLAPSATQRSGWVVIAGADHS